MVTQQHAVNIRETLEAGEDHRSRVTCSPAAVLSLQQVLCQSESSQVLWLHGYSSPALGSHASVSLVGAPSFRVYSTRKGGAAGHDAEQPSSSGNKPWLTE